MSIGIFIKQKKLIQLELRKEDADYELIYRKAKEKQFEEEELADKLLKKIMAKLEKEGIVEKVKGS